MEEIDRSSERWTGARGRLTRTRRDCQKLGEIDRSQERLTEARREGGGKKRRRKKENKKQKGV